MVEGCAVVSHYDHYTFAITTSTGKSYFLTARSVRILFFDIECSHCNDVSSLL